MSVAALSKLTTTAVTIAITATKIPASPLTPGRNSIMIHNNGSSTIFVGGSDVTVATGLPIAVSEKLSLEIITGDVLYGIVASGTEELRIMEGK